MYEYRYSIKSLASHLRLKYFILNLCDLWIRAAEGWSIKQVSNLLRTVETIELMAKVELIMPKMGESIIEATIIKWVKNVGDTVEVDETILEIATDKVDSEIPSPAAGKIVEILYKEDDIVEIGKVIAIIATEGEDIAASPAVVETPKPEATEIAPVEEPPFVPNQEEIPATATSGRFYSPLVKSIAKQENIVLAELDQINGSGANGRVTKKDILAYVEQRGTATAKAVTTSQVNNASLATTTSASASKSGGSTEIVQMDRMRKLIADHMVMSVQTSPHVTCFVEADVTNIVNWRNSVKKEFLKKHGQKITYTPIFIEAVAKAIRDFPMINVSVDNDKIIVKKDINIGMAAALPTGNLIVPVIKNADQLNVIGLSNAVNDLATRARNNNLKPNEIQDGTFTVTNVGTFGNLTGTPIINQPQVAILALGAIQKKPAVLETEHGDVIAIRHMMILSLSFDHRVVDGFLGGSFLRRVADYFENFDINQTI